MSNYRIIIPTKAILEVYRQATPDLQSNRAILLDFVNLLTPNFFLDTTNFLIICTYPASIVLEYTPVKDTEAIKELKLGWFISEEHGSKLADWDRDLLNKSVIIKALE